MYGSRFFGWVSTLLAVVLFLPSVAPANAGEVAGVFAQGRTRLSVTGGTGYAFGENYLVFGVGASYFVANGLSAGLDLEWWSSADPAIFKVSPSVQYVFYQVPSVSPYVGAFYRRSYIDGLNDLNSLGARAGFYIPAGKNTHIGVGAAYESYSGCDKSTYDSCTSTYPEISVTVAF
jgi:hypothetical protein